MATITEDYISFETAKLLKEKGFNELGDYYYTKNGDFTDCLMIGYSDVGKVICKNHTLFPYKAPTLQMAMKWLREVHKIGIFPSTYTFTIGYGTEKHHPYGTAIINLVTYELITNDIMPRNSYEQACETAIKYCLENLI